MLGGGISLSPKGEDLTMRPTLIIISVLTLLTILPAAMADTYVQGYVSGQWTVAGSPYIVQDEIYIDYGDQLSIEPGVEIKVLRQTLPNPHAIQVFGTLIANGAVSEPIIFKGNPDDPAADHWVGIKFLSEESSGSEVTYCEIYHAARAVNIDDSSPYIAHNIIAHGYYEGVSFYGTSTAEIGYNLIYDMEYRGIRIDDDCTPVIYNNTLVENGTNGIYITDSANPIIFNNIVGYNNSYGIRAGSSTSPVLSYNCCYGNTYNNYYGCVQGVGSISLNPQFVSPVSQNYNLQSSSPCIDAGDPASPLDPDGSRADMGAYYHHQYPEAPFITSIPDTTAMELLQYNYQVLATGYPDPEYSLSVNPSGMTIDDSSGLISWTPDSTHIGSNQVTVLALNNQGQDLQDFYIEVEDNLPPVITSSFPLELDTVEFYSQIDFSVTATEPNGQPLEYHWYHDGTHISYLSIVAIYFEALGDHEIKIVVSDGVLADSVIWNAFVPGTGISGNISGELIPDNNPHYMLDDCTVLNGDTLVIIEGTEIYTYRPYNFDPPALFVHGKLDIDGSSQSPVILTPVPPDPANNYWTGIRFESDCDPSSHVFGCYLDHASIGIEIEVASIEVNNCLISNCSNAGITVKYGSLAEIHHNTIFDNSGNGIYIYSAAPQVYHNSVVANSNGINMTASSVGFEVYNNIVADNYLNGIFKNSTSSGIVKYNNSYGNSGNNYYGVNPGVGGISANPMFVNSSANDYSLMENSPCIDAGDPYSPFDQDGTFPDMGAYYYQQSPLAPEFGSIPDTLGIAGYPYFYDPGIDGVPWPDITLISGPPGMMIDTLFGFVEYYPAPLDTGNFTVNIQAVNSVGTNNHIFNLRMNLNQPPEVDEYWPLELDTVIYHQSVIFGVLASDPESHSIEYTWIHNGLVIAEGENEITVQMEVFGNNTLSVEISDSVDITTQTWDFFVRGTQVNGNVSGCWNENNSPYVAMNNLYVAEDDSLIIDEGVHVLFAGNYGLTVNGYVEFNGSAGKMIVFNSNYPDPYPDSWDTIYLEPDTDDNSRISYCDIRHGHNALKLLYCHPQIDHCIFAYNGSFGIQLDHSNAELINLTSTHNQVGGIRCETSNPVIKNSIIAFNVNKGIEAVNSNPVLSYNDVYGNTLNYIWCNPGWASISENPLFVSLDDFHLTAASPCRDAGDPNSPYDPNNTIADMGALYYGALSVEPEKEITLPDYYSLGTGMPNPFNAQTIIEYSIPVQSKVKLTIYSILGQEIASLVDDTRPPGYHQERWDACHGFSSGIYFVRMSAEGFNGSNYNAVNKLVLVK